MSNKDIARHLNISIGTVKVHVKHLLHKIGLRNRLEVVIWKRDTDATGKQASSALRESQPKRVG